MTFFYETIDGNALTMFYNKIGNKTVSHETQALKAYVKWCRMHINWHNIILLTLGLFEWSSLCE